MTDDHDELSNPDWPKPDDSLASVLRVPGTRGRDVSRCVACLDWMWSGREHVYIQGYAEAAEVVLRHAVRSRHDQDTLVYPILFLFRHHVELSLKRIVWLARDLYECDVPLRQVHSLQTLWQDASKCMRAGGKLRKGSRDEWQAVGRCVRQLNDMDRESEAVRYPVDKHGEEHVLMSPLGRKVDPVTHVDLVALGELISKIVNFLQGVTDMLEAELEARAEMTAYFACE